MEAVVSRRLTVFVMVNSFIEGIFGGLRGFQVSICVHTWSTGACSLNLSVVGTLAPESHIQLFSPRFLSFSLVSLNWL